MKVTAQNALDMAREFREAAKAVGDYLYDQWDSLSQNERDRLRSMDVTLMNVATDLVTHAVGIVLDETQTSLAQLAKATKDAKTTLGKLRDAKKAIGIATGLIGLAAAIPTGSIATIGAAFQNLTKSTAA